MRCLGWGRRWDRGLAGYGGEYVKVKINGDPDAMRKKPFRVGSRVYILVL